MFINNHTKILRAKKSVLRCEQELEEINMNKETDAQ